MPPTAKRRRNALDQRMQLRVDAANRLESAGSAIDRLLQDGVAGWIDLMQTGRDMMLNGLEAEGGAGGHLLKDGTALGVKALGLARTLTRDLLLACLGSDTKDGDSGDDPIPKPSRIAQGTVDLALEHTAKSCQPVSLGGLRPEELPYLEPQDLVHDDRNEKSRISAGNIALSLRAGDVYISLVDLDELTPRIVPGAYRGQLDLVHGETRTVAARITVNAK